MAELLGISTSAYARMERGETSAELNDLNHFATALKIPLHSLLPNTLTVNNKSDSLHNGGIIVNSLVNFNFYSSDASVINLQEQIQKLNLELELYKKQQNNPDSD